MASLPERETGLFRRVRATKEKKEEVLSGRNRIWRDFLHLGIDRRIAASKTGAEQQQLAHQSGMTQGHLLHLQATDGETEQIDLGQPQCLDRSSNVVGNVLDPIAWCAGGRSDATAIEQDDSRPAAKRSVSGGSQWSMPARKWGRRRAGRQTARPIGSTANHLVTHASECGYPLYAGRKLTELVKADASPKGR